jgi:predicted kinase
MNKILPNQPLLIMLYGFPGSGKTYFARQFCENVLAAHLQSDRIRAELFEEPKYTKQENSVVEHLMKYMAGEFLAAGVSVVYDMNAMRVSQRHALRDLARQVKATPLLIWFQIDPDTAFIRNRKRDRRQSDDHYAVGYDQEQFQSLMTYMQNPEPTEDNVVTSGKHIFTTQLSAVLRKLYDMGVINPRAATQSVVKPELVNLIPKPPEAPRRGVRRNIVLR